MGSAIIEVGLGLVMVYFVLSVIVTQANNLMVNFLNLRAENLRAWFHQTFTDDSVRNEILTHPMINIVEAQMSPKRPNVLQRVLNRLGRWLVARLVPGADQYRSTTKVSYIAPDVFADVLLGVFVKDEQTTVMAQSDPEKVLALVTSMKVRVEDTPLEQTLETVIATAQNFQDARAKVAAWFDNSMNHLSAMFKRRVQVISFLVGLVIAIGLNVDSLHLARTLWNDPALRETVVLAAESASQNQTQTPQGANTQEEVEQIRQTVQRFLDLRLPIGWEIDTTQQGLTLASPRNAANFSPMENPSNWFGFLLLKIVGWVLTTFAIMQGSDFWFNLLGRIAQARTAVAKISETVTGANPSSGAG